MKIFQSIEQLQLASILTGTPVRVLQPTLLDGVVEESTGGFLSEGFALPSGNVFVPKLDDQETLTGRKNTVGVIGATIAPFSKDATGVWQIDLAGKTSTVLYNGSLWWPDDEATEEFTVVSIGTPVGDRLDVQVRDGSGALTYRPYSRFAGLSQDVPEQQLPTLQPVQLGDGTTTVFAAPHADSSPATSFLVTVDGVVQIPVDSYTTAPGQISFTEAPPAGAQVSVTFYRPVSPGELPGTDVSEAVITATGTTAPRTAAARFADVVNVKDFGAVGDGVADDTAAIQDAISRGRSTSFDLSKSFLVKSIDINTPVHMKDANLTFEGSEAGFNVDTAIDGFSMLGGTLQGDGNVANNQKGVTSNAPITNAKFRDVTIKDLVQGLDLHSAINPSVIGGRVSGSVGQAAGQGYGIVAGSSINGLFAATLYELCQRHALYLNNAKHTAVTGNLFKKHRDGLLTGGGLGALQIAGEATAIAESGNVFSECTGPELVISPQPTNTKPLECVSAVGGAHYGSKSASVRIGGATPSATELPVAVGVKNRVFMPDIASSGGVVQVYAGYGVDISSNTFYLKDGTGASPRAIVLGLTTPDADFFANISICNNNGIFTKSSGNAVFITICEEICLGTTRVDIFDNHVETDVLIDYEVTPTNPNIRTDDVTEKSITLAQGSQDVNVAGYNNFVLTGDPGGSTITNFINGYKGKVIKIRINDVNVISMASTGNKSLGGAFNSTNKDVITFEFDGTLWREQTRSLNT